MVRECIRVIAVLVVTLALVSAAQEGRELQGGPPRSGPPRPFEVMREHANVLRARAREAQELADRLRREADGLDEFAKAQSGPGGGPQGIDRLHRELMEVREAIGRAERDGRGQEAAELRRRAERLKDEIQRLERGPRGGGPEAARMRIEGLREEAARAKAEGRFEESRRLWDEAQEIERKIQREEEVGRMAEHLGAARAKAAALREQARRAKQEGRHDEAREQWEKAEQIERDLQEGVRKIERFKLDSEVKDLHTMAERAEKEGDRQKAEALSGEAGRLEERLRDSAEGRPPRDADLMRTVEELRNEIQQLRREMEEIRTQLRGPASP